MRILQTFILPDNLVAKHRLSFAAANFSRNLISGGGFDKVYSLIPTSVKGELESITDSEYEVVYSKWRKSNGIMSKLAIFVEQYQIFRQINNHDSIWLYNLNFLNALLFLLLKFLKPSVSLNIIVLDFTPAKNWREQNFWFLKLINAADGTICLSPSNLFTVKNSAVIPGVVPINISDMPTIKKPNKEFLLSGVICETIAMTQNVLDAFSKHPNCILHITGKVLENEDIICIYADKYPNIKYHGAIPLEKYLELLHSVTFQLSTRNPNMPENQHNFPSKIIEALLHNRAIVSTIQYPQLNNISYITVDHNNLTTTLDNILTMPDNEIATFINQGNKIKSMFNARIWNEQMSIIEEKNNKQ